MKLSWAVVASSLSSCISAARPSISPETARLILAQRLGLSRFHSIQHADAESIRHINAYGGRRQQLFGGGDADRSKAHLLMWIDDADQDEATVIINDGSDHTQGFTLSSSPSAADNDRLIQDFILQAQAQPPLSDPKKLTYTSGVEIDAALPPSSKVDCYNDYLTVFRTSKTDNFSGEELADILSKVNKKAEEFGFATTVIMMPVSKPSSKRAANSWGTYDVPSKEARRQNVEAILSSNPEPSSSPAVSDLESFPVILQAADKGPVRGILPSCFDSLNACQRLTHNCSTHGECKLLHKGRGGSGSNRESLDCYGCACSPTIKHVDEDKGMESKRQVTYWGGPACQKKDISVEFWLFVGSGVLLAFLVASGIGMLYSMGSEELPSVIGAGVSGPTRK